MNLNAYLPMDRVDALIQGSSIPAQLQGTVLFADISGFTQLTEAFANTYGIRRGAEEVTYHLNIIYSLLVDEVHRFRGSIIGFSGDAVTCWFNGHASSQAIQCGLAMQAAMATCESIAVSPKEVITLAIKVALATGTAHRFVVGDPTVQQLDVLAGTTIERMARAEHLARRGEIIADTATVEQAGALVREWRIDPEEGDRFAIITELPSKVAPLPWQDLPPLEENLASTWVIPSIYTRLKEGLGDFLTEIRSAVPLFLQFDGIDYERDPDASKKLDEFIRHVQHILAQYEGSLIQLTVGDKGSYLYAAFGVPIAQEDAAERAVLAALELCKPFANMQVKLGLSQGIVRTGTYGSQARRNYGVLGNEVNLAARLMQHAEPYQVIASENIRKATAQLFTWQELPAIPVKGMHSPVSIARLVGKLTSQHQVKPAIRIMVGRSKEHAVIAERLKALETEQQEGVLIIEGEAGIGKSTLLEVMIDQVKSRPITTLFGTGDAIEKQPYFAWHSVFSNLFGELTGSNEQRQQHILSQITLDPDDMELLPLLNSVLPLNFPESALTVQLNGEGRAYNTERLLVMLLQQVAKKRPLLLILEDAHWLDSPSWSLARVVKDQVHPLLMVLAIRPMPDAVSPNFSYLAALPDVVHLKLQMLPAQETAAFIAQRLNVSSVPEPVSDLIIRKAEGHPFFSEELIYALRDNGLIAVEDNVCRIVGSTEAFQNLNLPDTVEGVVASRIDKLRPSQQLTVKVASVIGRQFSHRILHDIYPLTAEQRQLLEYLGVLERSEIILQEVPEPQLAYLFRHIITVEVAYNLLLFSQRRDLHRVVAQWYESEHTANLTPHFARLAYHWSKAEIVPKKTEFLEKAGAQALASAAYTEAIDYFSQLLAMVERSELQISDTRHAEWELHLGEAYHGLFLLIDAHTHYERAFSLLGLPVPNTQGKVAIHLLGHAIRQFWHRLVAPPQLTEQMPDYERFRISIQTCTGVGAVYYMLNKKLSLVYVQFSNVNRAEQLKRSTWLAEIYAGIGMTLRFVGMNKLSDQYSKLGLEVGREVNDIATQAWVTELTYVGKVQSGQFANAAEHFTRSAAVFKRLGNIRRFHENTFYLAITYYLQGAYENSLEVLDIQAPRFDLVIRTSIHTFRAQALMQLGELEQSIALLQEGIAMVTNLASFRFIALYGVLGQIYLRQGAYDRAEAFARKAAPGLKDGWMLQYEGMTSVIDIFMALWEKSGETKADYQQETLTALAHLVTFSRLNRFSKARVQLYQGSVAWLSKKPQKAYSAWKRSLRAAQKMGLPLDEALALYQMGRHLTLNDPLRKNYLTQARMIFERLKTPYYLGLVDMELARQ